MRKPKSLNLPPYIIWVENFRPTPSTTALLLIVIAQRHRRFLSISNRWAHTALIHTSGPVFYRTPDELNERLNELIEAGKTHIPPNRRYMTSLSLAETEQIVDELWKPRGLRSHSDLSSHSSLLPNYPSFRDEESTR